MTETAPHTNRLRATCLALLPCLVFLALLLPRLNGMLGQDEYSHYYKLTGLLFQNGFCAPGELSIFSPHAYPLLTLLVCKAAGTCTAPVCRLCGILCWLACLALLAWRTRSRQDALWILACLPAAVQASLILDIDQALLPLACLLQCLAFEYLISQKRNLSEGLAILAFAFALWCRLTTPVLLAVPLLFCACLRQRGLAAFRAMLLGALLFLLTWSLYCRLTGVAFQGPFAYLLRSFTETTVGSRHAGLFRLVLNLLYLSLWGCHPFLLLLLMFPLARLFGKKQCEWKLLLSSAGGLYLCCALCVLLGYTFIGGALFGFPKYQCPALPLACMAIGLAPKPFLPRSRALVLLLPILLRVLCPDPLYLLRYTLRIQGSTLPSLLQLALPYCTALLCGGLLLALERKHLTGCLLLLTLAFNLPYAIRQSCASYDTGYIYGESGDCQALAQIIRKQNLAEQRLFVPAEVIQFLNLPDTAALLPHLWTNGNDLADLIQQQHPSVIALSSLIQQTSQLRELHENQNLNSILDSQYSRHHLGHLVYWLR